MAGPPTLIRQLLDAVARFDRLLLQAEARDVVRRGSVELERRHILREQVEPRQGQRDVFESFLQQLERGELTLRRVVARQERAQRRPRLVLLLPRRERREGRLLRLGLRLRGR